MRLTTRRSFIAALLISAPAIALAGPFSGVGKGGNKEEGKDKSSSEKSDGELTDKEKCAKYGHDFPAWPDWSTIPEQVVEVIPGVECIAFKQRFRSCNRRGCQTTAHESTPERDVPCPRKNPPACK